MLEEKEKTVYTLCLHEKLDIEGLVYKRVPGG